MANTKVVIFLYINIHNEILKVRDDKKGFSGDDIGK